MMVIHRANPGTSQSVSAPRQLAGSVWFYASFSPAQIRATLQCSSPGINVKIGKRNTANSVEILTVLHMVVAAKGGRATLADRLAGRSVTWVSPGSSALRWAWDLPSRAFPWNWQTFRLAQVPTFSSTFHVTICKLCVFQSLVLCKQPEKKHFQVLMDTR